MKNFFLILLLIFIFSCNQKQPVDRYFDLIDVSIDNGWADFFCIKVFNDGQLFFFNDNHHYGKSYFTIKLRSKELDSINTLSKVILNQPIDTLYKMHCADCGTYNIIIKSKSKTFHSMVEGIIDRDTAIVTMNQLVYFLHKIADSTKSNMDAFFNFESRTKRFYPVPPPPWMPDSNNILPDSMIIK